MPRSRRPAGPRSPLGGERLTAGQIFPATIGYTTTSGLVTSARRVGIAPRSSCPAALDSQLATALDRRGCGAVLRAAYTDASHAFVLTTGIAIMPSATDAQCAVASFGASRPHGGVKAVAFPGTVADVAGTAQSDWFGVYHAGPYVMLFAAGTTDGQNVQVAALNPALVDLAFGVERPLARQLAGQVQSVPEPGHPVLTRLAVRTAAAGSAILALTVPVPAPGVIAAAHHSAWKLAGYAVLILAGLIVMLRARQLRKRWRRRARLPTAQSHRIGHGRAQPPEPTPEPAAPVAGSGGSGNHQEA